MKLPIIAVDRASIESCVRTVYESMLSDNIVFHIGDGWMSILATALEAFSESDTGQFIKIDQVYSAGGTMILKWHYNGYVPIEVKASVAEMVSTIVAATAYSSTLTCEICGQEKNPKTKKSPLGFHGLCNECLKTISL